MTKPLLPTADKLRPYLERIDKSRWYSNYGELNAEYQSRLAELFGAPCVTGSSATSLITATLMALELPRGSLVAMPSWTFPATASAVVSAGLVPYFVDVDKYGELSFQSLEPIRDKIKAVIYVSPFGAPINMGRIDLFVGTSNIPVVIDAAAAFDAFSTVHKTTLFERMIATEAARTSLVYPVVISTHATKAFGTGEGGFVTCHDAPLLEKIRRITNFGLTPERRIEYTGLNAKFSEYHAAVGLASLDEWPEKRLKLLEAVRPYGLDYAVTQVLVRGQGKMGVYGCHQHKAYADYPRTELPVTEDLIANVGTVMVGI